MKDVWSSRLSACEHSLLWDLRFHLNRGSRPSGSVQGKIVVHLQRLNHYKLGNTITWYDYPDSNAVQISTMSSLWKGQQLRKAWSNEEIESKHKTSILMISKKADFHTQSANKKMFILTFCNFTTIFFWFNYKYQQVVSSLEILPTTTNNLLLCGCEYGFECLLIPLLVDLWLMCVW